MNFKSILFSREHIVSPFKINFRNREISIQDKKIKTIALSILVGLFTAGIGGLVFFYCLSAKYKVEKFNCTSRDPANKNAQDTFNNPESVDELAILKSESDALKPILDKIKTESPTEQKSELLQKNQRFINDFVARFLHPYITGQITKETDSKARKPMIELLLEKMPGFEPLTKGEIEEMVLNAFFEKAALGLYVNQKKGADYDDITSNSPKFECLVKALTEALPREFPNRIIAAQDLRVKASEALDIANKERKLALEQAFNFKAEGDINHRITKLEKLLELKLFFFECPDTSDKNVDLI